MVVVVSGCDNVLHSRETLVRPTRAARLVLRIRGSTPHSRSTPVAGGVALTLGTLAAEAIILNPTARRLALTSSTQARRYSSDEAKLIAAQLASNRDGRPC